MPRPIERLSVQREHGDALAQADGEEDPSDGIAWTLPDEESADARERHANERAGGLLGQADLRYVPVGMHEHQTRDSKNERAECDRQAHAGSRPVAHSAASGPIVILLISPYGVCSA